MDIKEIKTDGLVKEFKITIKNAYIEKSIELKISELTPKANLPGFRPGKVPFSILKARFGKQVFNEVANESINDASKKILEDYKINAASQPHIELKKIEQGEDIVAEFKVEVIPNFKIPDLTKLKLTKEVALIDDKQVDDAIKRISNENTKTEKVKDNRKIKKLDTVIIDFEGKINNELFEGGSAKGHYLKIGSKAFIPGFEDKLIGYKQGDNVEINLKFPKDYHSSQLANKEVTFFVKINEIRTDIKNQINDEFAKSLGIENLETLKKNVKDQMANQHSLQSRFKLKRQILDSLADAVDFEVPPRLGDEEYINVCKAMNIKDEGKKQQNPDEPDAGMSKSEKEDARIISNRRVRLGLVLSEIGRLNNIKVEEKDTQNAMMKELQKYPGREKEILDYFKSNPDTQNQFAGPAFEDKIIDFVIELADIKDKNVSVEDLYKDDGNDLKKEAEKAKSKKVKKNSKTRAK